MLINCAVTTKKSEREKTHLVYAEYVATKDSSLTKADGMEYYRYYSDFIKNDKGTTKRERGKRKIIIIM